MSNKGPFLPEATATWLIKNTKLTFKQIADFCHIHIFKVESVADGTISRKIQEVSPTANGQLTQQEIYRCEKDPSASLVLGYSPPKDKETKTYIPLAKRQDKVKAILWLLKSYSKISNAQINKLIKSSKTTIDLARNRYYPNIENISAQSPVELNLCSNQELEEIIKELEKSKL